MGIFSKRVETQGVEPSKDWYAEQRTREAEERENWRKVSEEATAEETKRFEGLVAEDEREKEEAKTFIPDVRVEHHRSGAFLRYEGIEVPAAYIASITVKHAGDAPSKGPSFHYLSITGGAEFYAQQNPTVIAITMISGQVHTVSCNRWKGDAVLAALLKAWRENR